MKHEKLTKMPIYQKALDILKIVERISGLVPKENEFLCHAAQIMYEDALQLAPKIAGAEAGQLYDLKMENAAIIRKSAREIYVHCNSFLIGEFKDIEYLNILRDEIEAFRLLFAEWVKTFDQWDYITDRWGLFNPPGVNYNDIDPDEDIPFDNPFQDPEQD